MHGITGVWPFCFWPKKNIILFAQAQAYVFGHGPKGPFCFRRRPRQDILFPNTFWRIWAIRNPCYLGHFASMCFRSNVLSYVSVLLLAYLFRPGLVRLPMYHWWEIFVFSMFKHIISSLAQPCVFEQLSWHVNLVVFRHVFSIWPSKISWTCSARDF